MSGPIILGLETSCDETAIGVVRGGVVLSNVLSSQVDEHARFGGVVPEVAARGPGRAVRSLPRAWGDCETVGATIDDAAGEAFDKVARFLGLGFPGGPAIDRASDGGDAGSIDFPRALGGRPPHLSLCRPQTRV